MNFKQIAELIDSGYSIGDAFRLASSSKFEVGAFSSNGIDDNSTSTAITIDASQNVSIQGALTSTRTTDGPAVTIKNTNASFSGLLAVIESTRAASGGFELLRLNANGVSQFAVNGRGDTVIAGNVSLGDSKHLYLGTSNDLDLYHDGSDSWLFNDAGEFAIRSRVNSSLINLQTYNSAGAVKTGITVGGATPNVSLYGGGVVHFSTKASSTYRTINFPAIPTSATGLSTGDVWSNSGVLTIV